MPGSLREVLESVDFGSAMKLADQIEAEMHDQFKDLAVQYTRAQAYDEIIADSVAFTDAVKDNCLIPHKDGLVLDHHKNTARFVGTLKRLVADYERNVPQTPQERALAECVNNALTWAADDRVYDRSGK